MNTTKPLPQLQRLLELVMARGVTTLDARRMGIMNCSQRITDLRNQGHPIDTTYTTQTDEHGYMHRVAMYVWNPQQKKQTELWN